MPACAPTLATKLRSILRVSMSIDSSMRKVMVRRIYRVGQRVRMLLWHLGSASIRMFAG